MLHFACRATQGPLLAATTAVGVNCQVLKQFVAVVIAGAVSETSAEMVELLKA